MRTFSGVASFMTRELEARFGPAVWFPGESPTLLRVLRRAQHESRRVLGRSFIAENLGLVCRQSARSIERGLARDPVDVLVAITVDQQLAYLGTEVPVVHLSDAIFSVMEDYYPYFSGLFPFARRAGHEIARRAVRRAAVSVFSSHWAAEAAVRDYGADPGRVHVVPYGANLDPAPTREQALSRAHGPRCRLLFMGVEWLRKGGDVAWETFLALRERGVDAELVVVGCRPPGGVSHPALRTVPFLDKRRPEDRRTYEELWRSASFFVLPSRQETFGAVFCEAAAHGVPALAARTGGVADAVEDGRSGFLLPPEARGDAYAERIAAVWRPDPYRELVRSSRDRYEGTLNWGRWGERVAPLVEAAAALGRRTR